MVDVPEAGHEIMYIKHTTPKNEDQELKSVERVETPKASDISAVKKGKDGEFSSYVTTCIHI